MTQKTNKIIAFYRLFIGFLLVYRFFIRFLKKIKKNWKKWKKRSKNRTQSGNHLISPTS
jgi:hypothetical protein